MGKSAIGWTDETWNCIRGCTEVSGEGPFGYLAPEELWLAAHGHGLRSADLKRITESEAGQWLIRVLAAEVSK